MSMKVRKERRPVLGSYSKETSPSRC